jgi:hypothetical protein
MRAIEAAGQLSAERCVVLGKMFTQFVFGVSVRSRLLRMRLR